uniref:ionotropic receptor 131 n=1 Tax=Aedes aegypti TaxID=7159 RepID=UPI000C210191|nr:ionotropic receptor 131 [Aedes aegypti]
MKFPLDKFIHTGPHTSFPTMTRIILCITLVITFCATSTTSDWISPVLLDYALSVIEHFNNQPGRFECILYDIGGGIPFDNWFVELLQSPRLFHIPHYVINMTYSNTARSYLTRSPTLMVMNLRKPDYSIDSSGISSMFLRLNPHTRILVLFAGAILSFMKEMAKFLTEKTLYTRVAFVEIRIMKVVRTGFDGGIEDFTDLVHPRELFRNLLRNLQGRPIRYTSERALSLMDEQWMEGTGRFLNGTAQYVKSPCDGVNAEVFMACYQHHLTDSGAIISVTLKEFTAERTVLTRMFFRVFPLANVVAVPGGKVSSVKSIPLCNLSVEAWIVSLSIATVLYLIDKSWLMLCQKHKFIGFFVGASIAVFLHSYGTRIMSFTIDRPRSAAIKSIEDLVHSSVVMKIRKPLIRFTVLEERLSGIPIEEDSGQPKLDGVSAYFGLNPETDLFVQSLTNYEDQKQLVRYQVLREYFDMRLGTYIVMRSDPLMELLYYTQRTFFEAGLLVKWTWDECERRVENWKAIERKFVVDVLRLEDLLLVWAVLGAGVFSSFIIFLMERFFRKM